MFRVIFPRQNTSLEHDNKNASQPQTTPTKVLDSFLLSNSDLDQAYLKAESSVSWYKLFTYMKFGVICLCNHKLLSGNYCFSNVLLWMLTIQVYVHCMYCLLQHTSLYFFCNRQKSHTHTAWTNFATFS